MPELPEVETIRRGLEPVLLGQKLVLVEQRRADLRFAFPARFAERLHGRTIIRLDRRAKYLLAHLCGGESLVMHLGMSGRFTICKPRAVGPIRAGDVVGGAGPNQRHDHVVFVTGAGATITYNDARRFGYMTLIDTQRLHEHKYFRSLGPEPLGQDFDAAYLAAAAHGRRSDLKAYLMDQRVVAGLGNIYVCEALHRAGLSPERAAASLAAKKTGKPLRRAGLLVDAIREVLQEAILAGGSTLRDYKKADGGLGYFQHAFAVYGREREACRRSGCKGRIKRISQTGRATFLCGICQR